MSAFWSPFGRCSPPPPPPPVRYGNVWRQKSSAGSLCGGWEQCDSCIARGHTAATATQGKKNIYVTAASKLSWGADLIKDSWWCLMCRSSHPLSQLSRVPSFILELFWWFIIMIIMIIIVVHDLNILTYVFLKAINTGKFRSLKSNDFIKMIRFWRKHTCG